MSENRVTKTMIKVEVPEVILNAQQPSTSECRLCEKAMTNMSYEYTINHVVEAHFPKLLSKITSETLSQKRNCCLKTMSSSNSMRALTHHFVLQHGIIFFQTSGCLSFMMQSVPPKVNNPTSLKRTILFKPLTKEMVNKIMKQEEYQSFFKNQMTFLKEQLAVLRKYSLYNKVDESKFEEQMVKDNNHLDGMKCPSKIEKQKMLIARRKQEHASKVMQKKLVNFHISKIEGWIRKCNTILSTFQTHSMEKMVDFKTQLDSWKTRFENESETIKKYVDNRWIIDKNIAAGKTIMTIGQEDGSTFEFRLSDYKLEDLVKSNDKTMPGKKKEELEQDSEDDSWNEPPIRSTSNEAKVPQDTKFLCVQTTKGISNFACSSCNATFVNLDEVYLHQERAHGIVRRYECIPCQKKFLMEVDLNDHKKSLQHAITNQGQEDDQRKRNNALPSTSTAYHSDPTPSTSSTGFINQRKSNIQQSSRILGMHEGDIMKKVQDLTQEIDAMRGNVAKEQGIES